MMVGAVASPLGFADEVALTLYQKSFFLDRHAGLAQEPAVLIPEVVEERQVPPEQEAFGYNRQGQMNRIGHKGAFIDTYR